MKHTIISCLMAFPIYAIGAALIVVPIVLSAMLSWWWLLLYIVTIPTFLCGREIILAF